MKNPNTHAGLLVLVGGYVLYIAYFLLDKLRSGSEDMAPGAFIALIAVFALAGAGVLFYAWQVWRAGKKRQESREEAEREAPDAAAGEPPQAPDQAADKDE